MSQALRQQLTVAPAILNFAARSATPGNLVEKLAVSNSGRRIAQLHCLRGGQQLLDHQRHTQLQQPPRGTRRCSFKFK